MKVELAGRLALLTGSTGPLAKAIAEALAANGASLAWVEHADGRVAKAALDAAAEGRGEPYLLVNVSVGAEGLPTEETGTFGGEINAIELATRHLAGRAKRVVNVISAAGLVPVRAAAAAFSAEQAGLAALTRRLAMELAPETVVNAVAVGAHSIGSHSPVAERLLGHAALKRPAEPSEIAAAVLFLADPANTYMTGHTLNVDGGWAAGYARNF